MAARYKSYDSPDLRPQLSYDLATGIMKLTLIVLLGLAAIVAARPDSIFTVDADDIQHEQDVDDDGVHGSYSWTSPEGAEYFVRYVADEDGFRVVESNAVPASSDGVSANGQQGSFTSFEEDDDK
ncbi:larval cuticle protein 2-like [Macrobrachium rosenbergii]|uniref:larval cuticle protein 2-like n=1 Tax=Macrobrachium rosenbergii TaxID=79674 RepID=UPI0034D498B6